MAVALPILTVLGAIGAMLAAMAFLARHARAAGWPAEVQRKLVHVGAGLFALTLPLLFTEDWPVYLLIGATLAAMAAMRLPALRHGGPGALLHSIDRRSWGDYLLALAVLLVFVLSDRDPLLYTLPLAVLTLGDSAAALAGSGYGRRRFATAEGHKTLEGSAILFMVTVILTMVAALLLSDIPRENVVVLAFLVAGFGALVEADSWRGFDNLFLPLGIWIVLAYHGSAPATELLGIAALFALALAGFFQIGTRLGAPPPVARVYLIAAFLLISSTALYNAVLPLAMLAAHLIAERRAPGTDRQPQLDAVAVLAVLGFGWLAAGNATGLNAITFFGASMAGLIVALAAIALSPLSLGAASAPLSLVGALTAVAWLWLIGFNSPDQAWLSRPELLIMATLMPAGFLPLRLARLFHRQRMLRLGLLTAVVPIVAYILLVLHGGPA
ncbi:MAG: hypothetical protein CSA74_10960 [Rhodobacterales bacterium]|nr:MAG: hypothetical protein CSA74_10960 [Rhodobacterales bacterium]